MLEISLRLRTRSSAVEHYVDIVGVTGSIPVVSTIPAKTPVPPLLPWPRGRLGRHNFRRDGSPGDIRTKGALLTRFFRCTAFTPQMRKAKARPQLGLVMR